MNSFEIGAQEAMTKVAYLPGSSHWKMRKALKKDKAKKIRPKSGPRVTRSSKGVTVFIGRPVIRAAKKGAAIGALVAGGAAIAHATRKTKQYADENPQPRPA